MQQDPVSHVHLTDLQWNPLKMQLTLRNVDKTLTYAMLTNSIKLSNIDETFVEQTCQKCKQNIRCLIFSIKVGNMTKDALDLELQDFKYCVLPFKDKQCRLQELLGHKNPINDKKHAIITNNLIISSQKTIKSSQEIDRTLFCTTVSSKASQQEPPAEDLSSSVVFSLQKEQEIIEHYELYVTKLQREVGEGYRSYMFYQYAWTEAEIQEIMHKMEKYFGSIHSFVPKRRYLCFIFARNKHDYLFKNKFESISKQLLFKQNLKLQGNILNYYLVSRKQLLPNEQQTGKLFLLPNNGIIMDMTIVNNWIIVAAESYIMFVHSQRPMQYFHHEQKIYPTQLAAHSNSNKIVYVSDKRGLVYCFQLQQAKVIVLAKYNVSFVIPYSLIHLQTGIAIAGIDNEQSKKLSRRSIFVVKIEGKMERSQKNHLPIEVRLEVVTFQGQSKNAITSLKSTKEKNVVACAWTNKFFLVSLQGFKLIEVELKSNISKLLAVPFLFNHLNFMLLLSNGDIVRVGIESYGQGLGAELCQINTNRTMDCILIGSEGSRFELYGCEGNKIDRISYLNDNRQRFLYENSGKIVKLASTKDGMAYLLDLDHSIELKYLQI